MRRVRSGSVFLVAMLALASTATTASTALATTNPSPIWHKLFAPTHEGGAPAAVFTPDGSRVILAGRANNDLALASYDPATGVKQWKAAVDGPGRGVDTGYAAAVTPDSQTVLVTGSGVGTDGKDDATTAAYDATTGARKWLQRDDGPDDLDATFSTVALTSDGAEAIAFGWVKRSSGRFDLFTVSYDTATGKRLWNRVAAGATGGILTRTPALAIAPDDTTAVVTGAFEGADGLDDSVTIAYDVATGQRRWLQKFDGPDHLDTRTSAVGIAPDGSRVFVGGSTHNTDNDDDMLTIAYDLGTGERKWSATFDGTGQADDKVGQIAVTTGGKVIVTGSASTLVKATFPGIIASTYVAASYDATTGARDWVATAQAPDYHSNQYMMGAMTHDGSAVYVTGEADTTPVGTQTVRFDTATGNVSWSALYANSSAMSVAVSPNDATVAVGGFTMPSPHFLALAYRPDG